MAFVIPNRPTVRKRNSINCYVVDPSINTRYKIIKEHFPFRKNSESALAWELCEPKAELSGEANNWSSRSKPTVDSNFSRLTFF